MAISLKEARRKAKLTQAQVAKELNVTRCTVDNWEHGRCSPDALHLKKLLKLYNVKFENIDFQESGKNIKSRLRNSKSDFQRKFSVISTGSITELCQVLGTQPDEEG